MNTTTTKLKIAIAIATAGRREGVAKTIEWLAKQSRVADELLVCPAKKEDFDDRCLDTYPGKSLVLHGSIGLPAQRNVLLNATESDIIIFFDDDFLPAQDYVVEIEKFFDSASEVVIATGKVLADGIIGPGIAYTDGISIVEDAGPNIAERSQRVTYNGYGCNMAVRMKPVREHTIRFDENLPLYAWLEDVDFSRQLSIYGDVVQVNRLRGVHLGTKGSGRTSGRRLGYSQIANPIYLARKGTMNWPLARKHMLKNFLANVGYSFAPEKWVDRRGRLAGNLIALIDLVRGCIKPNRILDL
ncbi:glycosyltransferase family 2 protein [Variovorax sp. RHLX14]|uniref:glycosyltransferase family 2 protein n=1 Tax=Variovorax sp. RHLX14 TaxID=1259731 RepID=UPI003F463F02